MWPPRLGSQVFALVVLAVAFTFAIYTILSLDLWREKGPSTGVKPQQAVLDLALRPLARSLQKDPRLEEFIRSANFLAPALNLREVNDKNVPARTLWTPLEGEIVRFLTRLHAVGYSAPKGGGSTSNDLVFIAELQNGTILASDLFPPIPPPRKSNLLSSSMVPGEALILLLVVLPIALLWAANKISLQLRGFAQAAEEFSMEGNHDPLLENGPAEIRMAVRAFNRMRDRIAKFATDRTKMLTAIGHDLRTPVTRIQLKTEFIADGELREGITRDIARMDAMINSALSFFQNGHADTNSALFSVQSLLQTICDDFADTGSKVLFTSDGDVQIKADADAIERAVENLLHNGIGHAKTVKLNLNTSDPEFIAIEIDDDGPGIPPDLRKEYIQPFVRGADTGENSGRHFGLGLSITNEIANAHDGRLELSDSDLGGLRARIILPR